MALASTRQLKLVESEHKFYFKFWFECMGLIILAPLISDECAGIENPDASHSSFMECWRQTFSFHNGLLCKLSTSDKVKVDYSPFCWNPAWRVLLDSGFHRFYLSIQSPQTLQVMCEVVANDLYDLLMAIEQARLRLIINSEIFQNANGESPKVSSLAESLIDGGIFIPSLDF